MEEVNGELRELTLVRLRQVRIEKAAQQLVEMRKDPVAWQAYIDDINAVSGVPIEDRFMADLGRYYQELKNNPEQFELETREDMEWQLGASSFHEDEEWAN